MNGSDKGYATAKLSVREEKIMCQFTNLDQFFVFLVRTGQDRTGQDRTGQDRTGQDRTGQDRTK